MSQTYTFSDTVTTQSVEVPISDDNINELDETLTLTATSLSSRVTIAGASASIVISDNDCK